MPVLVTLACAIPYLWFAVQAATLGSDTFSLTIRLGAIALAACALLWAWRQISLRKPSFVGPVPTSIVLGLMAILFVVRPLYDLSIGRIGSPALGYSSTERFGAGLTDTIVALAFAIVAFCAGLVLMARTGMPRWRPPVTRGCDRRPLVMFALFGIASMGGYLAVEKLRSFNGDIYAGLTVRHIAFDGSGYIFLMIAAYKIGAFLWIASALGPRPSRSRRSPRLVALLVALPIVPLDLVQGERAELLFTVLAFGLLLANDRRQRARAPVRPIRRVVAAVAAVAIGAVIFSGYRLVVRDTRGNASASDIAQSVLALPVGLMESEEAAAFDTLVRTTEAVPHRVPYRGIETIVSTVTASVPSAILPNKLERSGVVLTEALAPAAFDHGANLAPSSATDLYFTHGHAFMVVGMGALGLLLGLVTLGPLNLFRRSGHDLRFVFLSFYAGWEFLGVMRSDLFVLGLLPVRLAEVVAIWWLLQGGGQGAAVVGRRVADTGASA